MWKLCCFCSCCCCRHLLQYCLWKHVWWPEWAASDGLCSQPLLQWWSVSGKWFVLVVNKSILVATGEHSDVMEPGLRPTMTGSSTTMLAGLRRRVVSPTLLRSTLVRTMTAATTWELTWLASTTSGTPMRWRWRSLCMSVLLPQLSM